MVKHFLKPAVLFCLLLIPIFASCSSAPAGNSAASSTGKTLTVVAAEDFWGSIAAQLGGKHVTVNSIVSSPNVDPHGYESTANDARSFAQADYVILNGVGYDDWGQKLLDANPSSTRKVFNVGNYLGKKSGDNPHLWYNPAYVEKAADQITANYQALDPGDKAYYTQQRQLFEQALKPYHDAIATIQKQFAGQPIGSSESIYVYMAQTLHLNLITPAAYLNAENNGTEPPTSAVTQFNQQISQKKIHVMMLDVQNISNQTRNLALLVKQQHIPIVEITETIRPAGATFQSWQYAQLQALEKALAQ
ncbi:MAG TPA: zinc ABC transporter substrate-binding protein [Ktedonobacteraceae bacterium]|jgi:zinc/manganese transport system substrate-binding protein|nr:zinc ABC transporter substrate-binding protein [Ktedonobacteraceae bacterium]